MSPIQANADDTVLYDKYVDAVKQCIEVENAKEDVSSKNLDKFNTLDIREYLLLIKNIRIQNCSGLEEVRALSHDLNKGDMELSILKNKYLSIYIAGRVDSFSNEDLKVMKEIDLLIADKSLEGDLVTLFDELEQNQR
ncbi:hypothetical protein [Enterovibrio coralii]|nr:hypothetical protein [Enterovibrio coralii]